VTLDVEPISSRTKTLWSSTTRSITVRIRPPAVVQLVRSFLVVHRLIRVLVSHTRATLMLIVSVPVRFLMKRAKATPRVLMLEPQRALLQLTVIATVYLTYSSN
jgi:hypothetical protein